MPYSIKIIKELEELDPKLRGVILAILEEIEKTVKETVRKSDFDELKEIVANLGRKVEELAQAQKRTEERVEELAQAQKRTEQRVEELAQAQKKTEEKVSSLAEAVEKLTKSHYELKQEVGYLSHTVGYRLEDEAMKALPKLLENDIGIKIKGRLRRDFIEIGPNRYMEVNIFGYGESDGREYVVIGEAKSQLKKKDVDSFVKKCDSITRYIPKEQIKILVTYIASPQVQKYVKDNDIHLYFSFDF